MIKEAFFYELGNIVTFYKCYMNFSNGSSTRTLALFHLPHEQVFSGLL